MERIIPSFFDTDFYKITMAQMVWRLYPDVWVRYRFFNRGRHPFPKGFEDSLRQQVEQMAALVPEKEIISWLQERYDFLAPDFLSWIATVRFDPSQVRIGSDGNGLWVEIEGPWLTSIFWETPLMATITELRNRMLGLKPQEGYRGKAYLKWEFFQENGVNVAEFGARRRSSLEVHQNVLRAGLPFVQTDERNGLVGTSDVYLAHRFNLRPIGTIAHEVFMVMAALFGYSLANQKGLESWVRVYGQRLGIALPDTYTTDVFLRQFDSQLARHFDGLRQDSGNPFEFVDKVVNHYRSLGIDPLTKTVVFSDSLDPPKAVEIASYCRGKIKCSFGIGTNLTNDVGHPAPNWVIKVVAVKVGALWIPTVKLSDDSGKITTYEMAEVERARKELGLM